MDVTKTKLYRALKPAIRKRDHGNLRKELQRVMDATTPSIGYGDSDPFDETSLYRSFDWASTPQGYSYWAALDRRLTTAGWSCA